MNRIASRLGRRLANFLFVAEMPHLVACARFIYLDYVRRRMTVARNVGNGVAETLSINTKDLRSTQY